MAELVLGWIGLVSSLLYQGIALPRDIWMNYQRKRAPAISTMMITLSVLSYSSTTLRATLQPDWFDVGTRCVGALSTMVLLWQVFLYDVSRFKRKFPYYMGRKSESQFILELLQQSHEHRMNPHPSAQTLYWIRSNSLSRWRPISKERYIATYREAWGPFDSSDVPHYFASEDVMGLVTWVNPEPTTTEELMRYIM